MPDDTDRPSPPLTPGVRVIRMTRAQRERLPVEILLREGDREYMTLDRLDKAPDGSVQPVERTLVRIEIIEETPVIPLPVRPDPGGRDPAS